MNVYVINLDELNEIVGADDYNDSEFMVVAMEQNNMYTLKEFQDKFNSTEEIAPTNSYIRFIE